MTYDDDELGLHPSSGARYRRGKEAKGGSWLGCLAGGGADDAASAQYGATRSDPTDYQPLSDGQEEASAVSSACLICGSFSVCRARSIIGARDASASFCKRAAAASLMLRLLENNSELICADCSARLSRLLSVKA